MYAITQPTADYKTSSSMVCLGGVTVLVLGLEEHEPIFLKLIVSLNHNIIFIFILVIIIIIFILILVILIFILIFISHFIHS